MRAWVIEEHGGPEVFKEIELPTPEPGRGEVRIKVAATSVNPVDYKIRSGAAEALCPDKPAVLHGDVSGVVDAVGEGVDDFMAGQNVYGCVGGYGKTAGVLADYAIADAKLVAHAPKSIPLSDCAALPLVTITAWEGLDKVGELDGKQLLVHGGTGGVGHLVLQLAKVRGAKVATTVSTIEKAKLATELGADAFINYKEQTVEQYVQRITDGEGFDAVFDTIGGENIAASVQAAKLNGDVACIQGRGEIDGGQLHMRAVSLHLVFMLIPILHDLERERHGVIMQQAAALVDEGKLKPLIDDKRFTFEKIGDAHAYAESGKQIGKVLVLHPDHA
jgi:NADPH2:quinone reductase